MCNLKSVNLSVLISSGPCPGLTRIPFSTVHLAAALGSLMVHPLRSLPSNSCTDFPHFGARSLWRLGARTPVHCHGVPSGPVVVPESLSPESLPSKTMSSFLSSSSFGETNRMWPFEISTLGSGRGCPQRLVNRAWNCPPSSVISSHDGASFCGVFKVRSQRPRKDCSELLAWAELVFGKQACINMTRIALQRTILHLRVIMCCASFDR